MADPIVTEVHYRLPAVDANNVQIDQVRAVWDNGKTLKMDWPLPANIPAKPVNSGSATLPTPKDYWRDQRDVQDWLDAGNVPAIYSPNLGMSPAQIQERDERTAIKVEFDLLDNLTPLNRALLKLAFSNHNKIRVLEGNAPHTKQDFSNWLKANT